MAIFYLDYVNGNDANDGSTWALAWKTITLGATEARIAPGDIIRIAKSPAPTSIGNATWTNLSKTITLATAQSLNIELCETAFTASTNVTATTSTTRKEGSFAASLAIASAFTTGKVAHKSFTALNLSAYQRISFWFRNNTAIASATVLKVCLCSDTAGNTIVDTFYIPAIPSVDRFIPLTITRNGGGNLGASIQSIAVYADIDPGTPILLLDDFIACTTDGLNLQSLISKNSLEQGGTEGWYGIQSINGTTVLLDNETNTLADAGRGYSGTTETVATYKRETIKTVLGTGSSTVVQEVMDSGAVGNNIQFQGGWNTSTTVQEGETYFDGLNGFGYALQHSSKSYITLNYLNFSRYTFGIYYTTSNNNTITTLSNANNNATYGIFYSASNNNIITTLSNANNNTSIGVYYENASHNNTITTLSNANNNLSRGISYSGSNNNTITTLSNANNNTSNGVFYSVSHNNIITTLSNANNNLSHGTSYSGSNNNTITTLSNANNNLGSGISYSASNNNTITTLSNANNNATYGIFYSASNNNIITTLSTSENTTAGVGSDRGINYIFNALIAEATEVAGFTAFANSRLFSHKHDQTIDNHKIFIDGGLISSELTVRHTASGIAWRLDPTSTNRSSNYPLGLSIAKIAVSANNLVTVKAWFRRNNVGITGRLICRGKQIAGVDADVYTDMTAAADTWQELTITFTPTEAGVVEIEAQAWGGTVWSVFCDDLTITQA